MEESFAGLEYKVKVVFLFYAVYWDGNQSE